MSHIFWTRATNCSCSAKLFSRGGHVHFCLSSMVCIYKPVAKPKNEAISRPTLGLPSKIQPQYQKENEALSTKYVKTTTTTTFEGSTASARTVQCICRGPTQCEEPKLMNVWNKISYQMQESREGEKKRKETFTHTQKRKDTGIKKRTS